MTAKKYIGIDLGTTFSVAAFVDRTGHVICLTNEEGESLTASAVWLTDEGKILVGRAARNQAAIQPDRVALSFKRKMGVEGASFKLGPQVFSPEALSAEVLKSLRTSAERAIGPIAGAVITVPAYFGDRERHATLQAAALADLAVVDLINEPTAAALGYAFDAYTSGGGNPADFEKAAIASTAPAINVVCDLGGGTFDVTVIRVNGNKFDALATGGALNLGGQDWDEVIVDLIEKHALRCGSPDPHYDPAARARMRFEAERVKHELSVRTQVEAAAPYEPAEMLTVTREEFENGAAGLMGRCSACIERVMADAKLDWHAVEEVLLVGGATRMPMIRRRIAEISGRTPSTRLQPDLAQAQGAAVYAAILQFQGKGEPRSVVVAKTKGRKKSAKVSSAQGNAKETDGLIQDGEHWIEDPAFRAAAEDVRISNVNARGLGVMVRSPRYDKLVNRVIIPRNTSLPAERSQEFVTRFRGQERIRVPVIEGDVRNVNECVQIGECLIEGLPTELPAGSRVNVTFRLLNAGLVKVEVQELSTGHTGQTTLSLAATATPSLGAEDTLDEDLLAAPLRELAQVVAQMKR